MSSCEFQLAVGVSYWSEKGNSRKCLQRGLVYQSPDDDGDRDGSFSHLVFQISFAVRDKVPPEFLLGDVGKEWSVEYQVI